jgi:phosphoglycerate dehydrogenase-like enzyme
MAKINMPTQSADASCGTSDPFPRQTMGKKAAFFGWHEWIGRVYGKGRRTQIAAWTQLYPDIVDEGNFHEHAKNLCGIEAIFSTWGMPELKPGQLDLMPALRAVFYAGGSVRGFARPLLERHITVVSAWKANAVPVAEFTLGQILLAMKGYFRNSREYKSPAGRETAHRGPGCFGETVAILGAGAIGKKVIALLKPFHLQIIVFDPFLSDIEARELDVEKVSLETAFEKGYVISNHLADVPETEHLLNGALFERMRPTATFINTGRGNTVNEMEMINVWRSRKDITALLDVTRFEPPEEGSLLYSLPNVQLSTHIAGSIGDELVRMADYCLEEFAAWRDGKPLRYSVSPSMLETMA